MLCPIAIPLADDKLTKKILKTVKKASKTKNTLRRGVKEVVKSIRRGQKGLVILAGDVSPTDVISHLPVLCEDNSIPYIFVPSKIDLGLAAATKRPTCCLLIPPPPSADAEYATYYEEACRKTTSLLSVQ